MPNNLSFLVQCDFDGTVTIGDVSFQILDEFSGNGWRPLYEKYMRGEMSVNHFNATVFSRIKANQDTLMRFVRKSAVVRPGFQELYKTCCELGFRFVIVSNGMMFYIKAILDMLGMDTVEYRAAKAKFRPDGIEAWYEGPDSKPIEDGFKEAYTRDFIKQGYKVIYIGNGSSDFSPAKLCHRIYSIDNLTEACKTAGVAHIHFADLHEVASGLRGLS